MRTPNVTKQPDAGGSKPATLETGAVIQVCLFLTATALVCLCCHDKQHAAIIVA